MEDEDRIRRRISFSFNTSGELSRHQKDAAIPGLLAHAGLTPAVRDPQDQPGRP